MYYLIRNYCSKVQPEFYSHSTVKIFRKNPPKNVIIKKVSPCATTEQNQREAKSSPSPAASEKTAQVRNEKEYRENEMKIQMLSRNLFEQVFGASKDIVGACSNTVNRCTAELKKHGIKVGESPKLEDVVLKLPQFRGESIEDHFLHIAEQQCKPFKNLIGSLLMKKTPKMPKVWSFQPGWTCYTSTGPQAVEYPSEDALVFDVEVCVSYSPVPILATAMGETNWYSWVSPQLTQSTNTLSEHKKHHLDDLIPLGTRSPKIIVGHNVSYDRARIREQYLIEDTGARFLDTMSLHVCVSGVTSYQRAMLKSSKEFGPDDLEWSSQSSLNSLAEVYRLYCQGSLQKEPRDIFVKGSLEDVRQNFQHLMGYCAGDVVATQEVLRTIYPMFAERFPHPATLAGMLEIGSAYLPVNSNWNRYIDESNLTYEDLDIEAKYHLSKRADEACQLMHDDKWKDDLWMWDQDWSVQEFKMKKAVVKSTKARKLAISDTPATGKEESADDDVLTNKFSHLYETKSRLPARRTLLPGYPAWYRKLCSKPDSEEWSPGASDIGTGMQVTPKLLSLCWEGYPLHYLKEHGWGFLVPFRNSRPEGYDGQIPIERLAQKCPVLETDTEASSNESDEAFASLWKDVEVNISKKDYYRKKAKVDKTSGKYTGTGVWCNVTLEGCCYFLKLPHKNGPSFRVGNPLAKDFLNKFSENVLSGDGGKLAERVIEIAKMLSYWRNNRDRIMRQLVVWLSHDSLPDSLRNGEHEYGAIIPQVVVCGTLTRRAMEPTWMTASNAQRERVGSELRSMIQAPKGYKIVGADVDSQELWIASVLGDAHATGMHGATPLGWMTLSGTKSDGTDMHSVTAKAVGISRDHAKVINYARIYGAGQNFAERLLKQFNPTISDSEAKSKAMKMFSLTKGRRYYRLREEFQDEHEDRGYSGYEALKIASSHNKSVPEMFTKAQWVGGTESAMFNRLEEIAGHETPSTPFLTGRLSRSLEPKEGTDDRFLPTRVNWVVQSGAVDFLHLMLVSMRWLMGPNVRFCLSFHDELRYLVKEDLAYKAALAMHVTNLLTRAFCSHRIGLKDLPQSVAFFSSVEVDTVLRKESTMDCKTPSNPHGLEVGYGIPKGESIDVYTAIQKANGADMSQWEWHRKKVAQ